VRRLRPLCRALGVSLLGFALLASTASADTFHRDTTPLPKDLTGADSGGGSTQIASGGGGSAIRMFVGLAIVLAVIYGLYRVLKRASRGAGSVSRGGDGITLVASTSLGSQQQAVHLLRIGDEVVLVGAAGNAVTPIRVYTADEARRLFGPEPLALAPALSSSSARAGFLPALLEDLRRRTAR
jgi:flagellar biogenesis protein FliO